ncbi:hypothetical protein [Streptomyces sp. NPDC094468]|uniref:hypothetical protein n=1 Tax=Streptomyces sp. NPDC094468 TaxID=3366066 RepID=UPI00381A6B43
MNDPIHYARAGIPMRDGYLYDATGVGVRSDLIQAVIESWGQISPTGDPALPLRSVNDGHINRLDNLARLAAQAVAVGIEAAADATVPASSKAESAREDLLTTFSTWMLTTARGSRAHADRILARHAREHADRLLTKAGQLAILRSEDARLKAEGLRIGAALIAPEDTR